MAFKLITDNLPQYDNNTIKYIESIRNVFERAFSYDLQQHLDGKNGREDYVTDFHDYSQFLRLIMVFNTHGQSVNENRN